MRSSLAPFEFNVVHAVFIGGRENTKKKGEKKNEKNMRKNEKA